MEAKITFLTQVLWGSSVCSCVQSILYAGRYNPLTYGEQQQNQEQVIQFQNTLLKLLCTIISGAILWLLKK